MSNFSILAWVNDKWNITFLDYQMIFGLACEKRKKDLSHIVNM